MNTPSKETLDASEAVQDYFGFPRRATMDIAAIIDRHIEPLRQRAEQAEARVKELDELYRDLRVAYEQNAHQCVKLNRELGQETTEWLNGTTIQRKRAEKAEARVKELETSRDNALRERTEAIEQGARDARRADKNAVANAELKQSLATEAHESNVAILRLQQANAELAKQEAESRRLFYAEQDKRQSAEFRCEELAGALRNIIEIVREDGSDEGYDRAIAREAEIALDPSLARYAAGEPEAQK